MVRTNSWECTFLWLFGWVWQSRMTPHVKVNVASNWANTSVAAFTPIGRWLHFTRPTANSENGQNCEVHGKALTNNHIPCTTPRKLALYPYPWPDDGGRSLARPKICMDKEQILYTTLFVLATRAFTWRLTMIISTGGQTMKTSVLVNSSVC